MTRAPWMFPLLLSVAGVGLWLLFAGPSRLLGIDPGNVGVALLMLVTWVSLYRIGNAPRTDLDKAVAPGEWKAWVGLAFMTVAVSYFLRHLLVFSTGMAWNNPEAQAVGKHLVLLLIAWSVLSAVMRARWKGAVEDDERDRDIARQAAGWGRGATVVALVGLAVTLGFSPPGRLQWASHLMIANLLILVLMWGCLVEYAVSVVHYWRDRH